MENIRQKKVELIAAWFRNLEFIREAMINKSYDKLADICLDQLEAIDLDHMIKDVIKNQETHSGELYE